MTPRQHELLVFIRERIGSTGVCPSYSAMANALGMSSKSKGAVARIIEGLVERKHLVREPGTARTLALPEAQLQSVPTALLLAELSRRGLVWGAAT